MTVKETFEKVVFLLGAGASKEAGCLLSAGMLSSLLDEINSLSLADDYYKYKDDFLEIYNFIIASLNYQASLQDPLGKMKYQSNIEDFVMILRQLIDKEFIIPSPLVGNWNDKIICWKIKYNDSDIFGEFKNFITRILINKWTKFDDTKAENTVNSFRELVGTSEDFKINIFSLNYDLVFENKLNSATEKIVDDGFSEKKVDTKNQKFWAEDFNDENSPSKINLYKLHGSVNWKYDNEHEEILYKEDVYDNQEPLIIFGSFSKMLSFDPFLYMLSKFRDLLHEATILFVIGYSFHDKYINNMIIQQISNNTQDAYSKKMIVVDPYCDDTEQQFSEKLEKIQKSKSINDIINFTQLSHNRIKIVKKGANDFFDTYFKNNAELISEELATIQSDYNVF